MLLFSSSLLVIFKKHFGCFLFFSQLVLDMRYLSVALISSFTVTVLLLLDLFVHLGFAFLISIAF